MAIKQIRIGSMANIHQYDNVDFADAIDTREEPIAIGDPVEEYHAVNLRSMNIGVLVANVDNPTELALVQGKPGKLILAIQQGAGSQDIFTLYAYDEIGPALNSPYVVLAAPPDGFAPGYERWIAIGGKYSNQLQIINAQLIVNELSIRGTLAGFELAIVFGDGTANQILTFNLDSADRSLTLHSDVELDQDLQTTDDVEFNTVKCQGNQVLGAQQAAIANATDPATTMARLNDLLAACRTHGLIDT
jgi:hypothetical protein